MGKHGTYPRVKRDLYPTPAWVIDALANHLELKGRIVWEPACGDGRMATALVKCGARVIATDIAHGPRRLRHNFLDPRPVRGRLNMIVTNPPFGPRGSLAEAFIKRGLDLLRPRQTLALLLPCDFDSAATRASLFGNCTAFRTKLILRRRIVWFQRTDGVREAPKENHAWFIWQRPGSSRPPTLLYAP